MAEAKGVAAPKPAPAAAPAPVKPAAPPAPARAAARPDNVVFIGNKPPMNYVLAIVAVFNGGSEAVIRARGKAISRAVDVAEIVRNKFVKGATVKAVGISTERVTNEAGRPMNVSAIEIVLAK